MTIENTVANAAEFLAGFYAQRTAIAARKPAVGNYVLRWYYEGSSLFVGKTKGDTMGAVGFGRASFFGDKQAALAFLRRTQIRNGHGSPVPVLAFNAQQGAIADIEGVIRTMETMRPDLAEKEG